MAGETWKSHQITTRERDMNADHAQQIFDLAEQLAAPDGDVTADPDYRECGIYRPDGSFFIGWMHVDDIARQIATAQDSTVVRVLPAAA